ncbi:MAG: hypothetical protein U0703_12805 [Anaerolineae bacterium]
MPSPARSRRSGDGEHRRERDQQIENPGGNRHDHQQRPEQPGDGERLVDSLITAGERSA